MKVPRGGNKKYNKYHHRDKTILIKRTPIVTVKEAIVNLNSVPSCSSSAYILSKKGKTIVQPVLVLYLKSSRHKLVKCEHEPIVHIKDRRYYECSYKAPQACRNNSSAYNLLNLIPHIPEPVKYLEE